MLLTLQQQTMIYCLKTYFHLTCQNDQNISRVKGHLPVQVKLVKFIAVKNHQMEVKVVNLLENKFAIYDISA